MNGKNHNIFFLLKKDATENKKNSSDTILKNINHNQTPNIEN